MNTKTVHNQQTVLQALWNNSATTGTYRPHSEVVGKSPQDLLLPEGWEVSEETAPTPPPPAAANAPDTSQHIPAQSRQRFLVVQGSGTALGEGSDHLPPSWAAKSPRNAQPFLRYGFWWISIWNSSNKVRIIFIIFNLNHKGKDFQISVNIFSQNKWQNILFWHMSSSVPWERV